MKRLIQNSKAFTIVELVVVIAVLGILAGVSAAVYGGWKTDIAESTVKSDLNQVYDVMHTARNFQGSYPTSLPSTFEASDGVTVTYVSGNAQSYCVEAKSKDYNSIVYSISSSNNLNVKQGSCSSNGGSGGSSAPAAPSPSITNSTTSSHTVAWSGVSGATSYTVKYGTKSANTTASCSSSPCTISGLSSGTLYFISVTASNANGSNTGNTSGYTVGSYGSGP